MSSACGRGAARGQTPGLSANERQILGVKYVVRLAVRESKSERSIRMTLSLAFISPVLAEAAMAGRLPRGFSVKRLTDLPMLWLEQWGVLGLQEPVHIQVELG